MKYHSGACYIFINSGVVSKDRINIIIGIQSPLLSFLYRFVFLLRNIFLLFIYLKKKKIYYHVKSNTKITVETSFPIWLFSICVASLRPY